MAVESVLSCAAMKSRLPGDNFRIIQLLGFLTNVYLQFVEQPFQPFQQ